MYVQGDRIHPLWLQQSACRLRWLATKAFPAFVCARLGLHWWESDRGTPVQCSNGCFPEFCAILCQFLHNLENLSLWARPAALDLLHYVEGTVQSRYALVVACFVGRNLGPAFYREVVLQGLGLAWSCGHQEHATNWFENYDIDLWTTVTNRVSDNRTWNSFWGVI